MSLFCSSVRVALCICFFTLVACSESLTEEELISRASAALASGDAAAAEVDIKTALQQNANNPTARSLYGEVYLWQINPAAAVEQFERSLEYREAAATRVLLAKALVQTGESAELVSDYEAGTLSALESSPEFMAAVARAYLSQAEPEAGREVLALISADGYDYVDITRAVFALQVDRDVEAAQDILTGVTARNPRSAHAWSLLGLIANSKSDRGAAEEYFGKAVAINPYRIGDRLERVNALLREGKSQVAAERLASLERMIPNYPEVNFMRGQLLFDEQRYEEAIDSFSMVLQARPAHLGALILSANANVQVGNLTSAQRQLTDFLSLQPGHLQAGLQLGKLFLEQGNAERAESVARSTLEQHPDSAAAVELVAASLAAQGLAVDSVELYQQLARMQPDSSQILVALGIQQLVAGDSEAAIARLEEAVAMAPDSAQARERLIEANMAIGQRDAALAAANAYLAASPDTVRPMIYMGRVQLQREDFDAAGAVFERALALDPGNSAAAGGVAAIAVINEDLDGARAAFEDALEARPGDLVNGMNLAVILEQAGDTAAMTEVLSDTAEANAEALAPRLVLARLALRDNRPGEAISLLLPLQESAAKDYRFWQVLTGAYLVVGQIDAASGSVDKLLELRPEDPAVLALAAEVSARSGRADKAQAYVERALAIQPDSEPLRQMLVQALVRQNKLDEAGEQLAFLSNEVLEQPNLLTLRGRLALRDGDAVAAEPLLQRAFDMGPSSANVVLLSLAQWEKGGRDEPLAQLRGWLQENPDDTLVRTELARLELSEGDEAGAAANYQAIINVQPDNPLALNNLAWLLRKDDPDAALKYIQRAETLAGDSAQIKDTYAIVELERGNTQRAIELIDEALELAPGAGSIYLSKARILASAGRNTEARQILSDLASDLESAEAAEAEVLLRSLP